MLGFSGLASHEGFVLELCSTVTVALAPDVLLSPETEPQVLDHLGRANAASPEGSVLSERRRRGKNGFYVYFWTVERKVFWGFMMRHD